MPTPPPTAPIPFVTSPTTHATPMLELTPRAQEHAAQLVAAALHPRILLQDSERPIHLPDDRSADLDAAIEERLHSYINVLLTEANLAREGFPPFRHPLKLYLKAFAQDLQLAADLSYIAGSAAEFRLHLATLDKARKHK